LFINWQQCAAFPRIYSSSTKFFKPDTQNIKTLKGEKKSCNLQETFSGVMNDFGIVKSCQWCLTKKACTDFTAVITFFFII
jgi:hypothetical protein